jgi:hypothetical protein
MQKNYSSLGSLINVGTLFQGKKLNNKNILNFSAKKLVQVIALYKK